MMRRPARLTALILALTGCAGGGPPPPAALDTDHEACGWCRMAVSDPHLAAQIVAPLEEPVFFDDIGCLRDYLAKSGGGGGEQSGRTVYVADHVTAAWVPARSALYTKAEGVQTPMGSHIIAHAGEEARRADPAAQGGVPMTPAELFGPAEEAR